MHRCISAVMFLNGDAGLSLHGRAISVLLMFDDFFLTICTVRYTYFYAERKFLDSDANHN